MKKNFSVLDGVAIQAERNYCDLHNDFDLRQLSVDFIDRTICLRFTRSSSAGSSSSVECLVLDFVDVDYLDVSTGVLREMIQNIVEVGYKSPEDFDHDWLMNESQATTAAHLFLRLSGDEFIRLHSRIAKVTFESNGSASH